VLRPAGAAARVWAPSGDVAGAGKLDRLREMLADR
jgi:hypothetical protein